MKQNLERDLTELEQAIVNLIKVSSITLTHTMYCVVLFRAIYLYLRSYMSLHEYNKMSILA